MNVIASYRPKGFVEHLHKFGIYPTILTHHWEREDGVMKWHSRTDKPIYEKYETHSVIRIPRQKTAIGKVLDWLMKNTFVRKLIILTQWLCGYIDTSPDHIDSYLNFKSFLRQHLQQNNYDLIIGIYSPHHHLRLCYNMYKKFNVKYALDFRDLWSNGVMNPAYKFSTLEKFKSNIDQYYWKKWLSHSLFYTTTNDLWCAKIGELTDTPGYKVMHGYDILDNTRSSVMEDQFMLLYAGTCNQTQDLDLLGQALKDFINTKNPENFKMVFLGSKRPGNTIDSSIAYLGDPTYILSKYLDHKYFLVTPRVSREETFSFYKKASILILPIYEGVAGQLPGKLFEYLGAGKTIISYPDEGEIGMIIKSTKTGYSVNSAKELSQLVCDLYDEWKIKGKISLQPNQQVLETFSRKHQTKILSEIIKNKCKDKL